MQQALDVLGRKQEADVQHHGQADDLRKEGEPSTLGLDHCPDRGPLVAGEVVHDYDVAGAKGRRQHLRHVGVEPVAVDRTVEDRWGEPGPQAGAPGPVAALRRASGGLRAWLWRKAGPGGRAVKLHFISGLPRSSSTLLAGLLHQNPRFHAAMTGPAASLVDAPFGAFQPRTRRRSSSTRRAGARFSRRGYHLFSTTWITLDAGTVPGTSNGVIQ